MGVFRFGIMGAAKIGAKFCDAVSRLPQAQVAAALGTTQQVYARYEKGVNELPVRHLRALCLLYYILDLPEGLKRPR